MPTDAQKLKIMNAVSAMRAAENLLLQASRKCSSPLKSIQINTEYQQIDSCLSQLIMNQLISDDKDFLLATASINEQSVILQGDQTKIEEIVMDADLAAKIAGYLSQAAKLIATI